MFSRQLSVVLLLVVSGHSSIKLVKASGPEFHWEANGCHLGRAFDQGDCSAGHAYAVAAAIHLRHCSDWKTNPQPYSESAWQIIDCSTRYGRKRCEGGSDVDAFKYVIESQGLSNTAPCAFTGDKIRTFRQFENVSEEFLMQELVRDGPKGIVVGIDTVRSFHSYKGGVYSDPECKSGTPEDSHYVLVIGYGHDTVTNTDYWEILNSFGPTWGIEGRARIARAGNICGIRTRISFPEI